MTRSRDPLHLLERAAIAEEVAAALRHDLRNRLASVRNAAYYLDQRTKSPDLRASDPRIAQFFTLIEDQITDCDRLLDRASFADVPPRVVQRVRALACAERAASLARTAVEVAVSPAHDGEVLADPAELALALRCLIENAAEASPEGARVDVEVRPAGAHLVIEVRDQGPGIPDADRDRVPEPLHTTKPGHVGVGLAIARRIAHRYGGALELRPAPRGACVALVLPAAGDAVGAAGGGGGGAGGDR